jgi:hypothetical protein
MRIGTAAIVASLALVSLAGCESSAQPPAAGMLAYQVDEERSRSVWLTREGVQIHSAAARPVSLALPGWIYAGTPHCPPGLAIGAKGEIVVTSNVIPTIWRIDAATQAVTVHALALDADQDKDVGFAAVIYAPEQRVFVAYSEGQRSVWKIDADLNVASKVAAADFNRARSAKPCAEYARRLAQPASH